MPETSKNDRLMQPFCAPGRLALAALGVFVCMPVYAEPSPFDLTSDSWMSYQHYQDAVKSGHIDLEHPKPPPEDTPAPAPEPASVPTDATPPTAPPSRPISLPGLPAFNKGFDVRVESTEEERHIADVAPRTTAMPATPSAAPLSEKNWQSPLSSGGGNKDSDAADDDRPLTVRPSQLPTAAQPSVPSVAERETAQHRAHIALEKGWMKPKDQNIDTPKTPAEAAACAAIDNYKKQQLTAIQSDRQTLRDLQAAIASLGLQKQLDFMANSDGALNVSGGQTSSNVSTPAPTTVR